MNKKVEDLQLLRGVAIALVVFGHLSLSSTLLDLISKDLSKPFYWGVELFFVLSGFVVTKSIRSKRFNPAYFLIKRIFRLYPAIIFLICCSTLINAFITKSIYPDFIRNLFSVSPESFRAQSLAVMGGYLINLSGPFSYQFGAMWSLSVEFQFYAFVTALLFVFMFLQYSMKEKALAVIVTAILMAIIFYRAFISFAPAPNLPVLNYLANYKFDFMAAGVLLAYVPAESLRKFLSFSDKPIYPILALLVTTVFLTIVRSPLTPNTASYNALDGPAMIFTLVASTYMVALGAIGNFSATGFCRPLRRFLIMLGDYSYTIYLIHFPVFVLGWMLISELLPFAFSHPLWYGFIQLVIVCALLIPFVNFGYYQVELRSIALGDKIVKKLPAIFNTKVA